MELNAIECNRMKRLVSTAISRLGQINCMQREHRRIMQANHDLTNFKYYMLTLHYY